MFLLLKSRGLKGFERFHAFRFVLVKNVEMTAAGAPAVFATLKKFVTLKEYARTRDNCKVWERRVCLQNPVLKEAQTGLIV